jgi:hypothetical protein
VGRPSLDVLPNAVTALRRQLSGLSRQSERTLLLGTVLLASTLSLVSGAVLAQYFSVDVLSSLLYVPQDCWYDSVSVGRHCFADYASQVRGAMLPNPWAHVGPPAYPQNPYPPGAMVPFLAFGLLGKWMASARVALFAYLLASTIAVLTPALWAARGTRGLDRIVVFVACGAATIPAWTAIDRGNSAAFLAPISLFFLIGLRRHKWGQVALMVVLAGLVKPHFVLLVVALFAARQWRLGAFAIAGVAIPNLAGYLLWPQDFPETITQSIHNAFGYGFFYQQIGYANISFAKALLAIPDHLKAVEAGGTVPEGFLVGPRTQIGYTILLLVAAAVLALGRRIPPVMVGIALLATATFFPAVTYRYYLVFALAVAALVVRDPDAPPGLGIFDRLGDRRRAVGICVSLATALSIANFLVPGPPIPVAIPVQPGNLDDHNTTFVLDTTVALTPLWWLIACVAIIVSYARKPAPEESHDASTSAVANEPSPDVAFEPARSLTPPARLLAKIPSWRTFRAGIAAR